MSLINYHIAARTHPTASSN